MGLRTNQKASRDCRRLQSSWPGLKCSTDVCGVTVFFGFALGRVKIPPKDHTTQLTRIRQNVEPVQQVTAKPKHSRHSATLARTRAQANFGYMPLWQFSVSKMAVKRRCSLTRFAYHGRKAAAGLSRTFAALLQRRCCINTPFPLQYVETKMASFCNSGSTNCSSLFYLIGRISAVTTSFPSSSY